jgi:hypothetical protein
VESGSYCGGSGSVMAVVIGKEDWLEMEYHTHTHIASSRSLAAKNRRPRK